MTRKDFKISEFNASPFGPKAAEADVSSSLTAIQNYCEKSSPS